MTVKISNLPAATSVGSGDVIPVVQSGTTKKIDLNSPWSINIDGGAIDGTPIGASSASTGAFSTLTTTNDATINGVTVGIGDGASTSNVAHGLSALDVNTSGTSLSAFGGLALSSNTTGSNNTAIGRLSMRDNETGGTNVALGDSSLRNGTSSSGNTAIGHASLIANNGSNNVAIGKNAGNAITTGSGNTILGANLSGTSGLTNSVIIGAGGAEKMRIDSSGNVGIGQTTNLAKLTVNSGTGNIGGVFKSSDAGAYIGFADDTTTLTGGGTFPYVYTGAVGDDYVVGTNNAERMRIDSSGNVLIGTTGLPSSTGIGSGFVVGSGDRRQLRMASTRTTETALVLFYNPNGEVGSIATTSSATAYNTSSDYRLKENAKPLTGALAKVQALNPVRYNWKVDGSKGEGFIAHELQEIVPYAVTGEKDGEDMQGVDYGKLTTLLTAAIKELKAELDELKGAQ